MVPNSTQFKLFGIVLSLFLVKLTLVSQPDSFHLFSGNRWTQMVLISEFYCGESTLRTALEG